ncbi:polynucleotide 5-hydroxyl-kinase [Babesia ovis]|uniref:Polynucleotide 5-hydroxyl-kinase n=1 Tax=Babesia ovis TaxID=5869 RepID=A0A9W5TB03_BABOV|nr:polynucleotide 5-hydroxyl-kinase [Babesia ovis]
MTERVPAQSTMIGGQRMAPRKRAQSETNTAGTRTNLPPNSGFQHYYGFATSSIQLREYNVRLGRAADSCIDNHVVNNLIYLLDKLLSTPATAPGLPPSMRGAAEIYGRELVPDVECSLEEGERLALFTWIGCSVQVKGNVEQEYEGEDHAMKEYLNVVNVLNAERELASVKRTQGPRVLITGAPSSGKSSAAMLLCNYAVRSGWTPVCVEADPRGSTDKKQIQFYPGTIGATVVTGAVDEKPKNPLVYFYGYTNAQENEKLYLQVSQSMAAAVDTMMERSCVMQPHCRRSDEVSDVGKYIAASGMVINAPHSANRDLIVKLVEIYNVSLVLVIDSPSVHQDLVCTFAALKEKARGSSKVSGVAGELLSSDVIANLAFQEQPEEKNDAPENNTLDDVESKEQIKETETNDAIVLAVNKLEGVVPVDHDRIKYLHDRCWRRYFDRTNTGEVHVIRFPMENVQFMILETCVALSNDALPHDELGHVHMEEVYAAPWNGEPASLTHAVLGVPASEDPALIPYCNLTGFFLVRSVEEIVPEPSEGTEEDELEQETPTVKYMIEVLCAAVYSPSSLPACLLVPGGNRSMRWQAA